MKRVLTAPIRFLGALGQFANPRLKAGRVPLGRSVIVVQLVVALIFVGYTLTKKSIRLPFASKPYTVQLVFAEAKGLDKYDQPAAGIAGAYAGQVTEVHYEDGRAVATLTLDPSVRGKIFSDASAALRPASAIQNLLVNVDPGSPEAGPLPEGTRIPQSQTSSYVAIDELTSVLDTDTQAYVQILIDEIQRALDGVEGDFRVALEKLGEIADSATPISRALAERRKLLTRVTDNLDEIFTTLAIRGDELGEVIDAGATTLEVTAARETELARAIRELAPLVVEADRSLAATTSLAQELLPALDQIVPAADSLPAAAAELRGLVPIADRVFEQVGVLVEKGQYPLELFVEGTRGINRRLQAQIPVVQDLTYRARLLDRYKDGMVQFADTWSGAFSVNDNLGPYGQVAGLKLESPRPENFGLQDASASVAGAESLNETLAIVLENVCLTEGGLACMARFATPGLEDEPVTVTASEPGDDN